MNEEFVNAYHQLDLPTKKEKLCRELHVIGEYLKDIENKLGFANQIELFNYHPINNKEMTEEDYMTNIYQDIFNIERELITIERLLEKNKKKEGEE